MNHPQTVVIAEAGVNHNGSLDLAIELVDAAAAAGADVVKFQTFNARLLASAGTPKTAYQVRQTGSEESQLQMLERLQLSIEAHRTIIKRCTEKGIRFLSSPFDMESAALLSDTFGLRELKIGSGELTNAPLLIALAQSGCKLILSTGMSTLAEVEQAIGVIAFGMVERPQAVPSRMSFAEVLRRHRSWILLKKKLTLLHCTTEYPATAGDANLKAMDTMRAAFGLKVGFSDHTEGWAITIAAVARGAEVIEKHFTLDRDLPGPDQATSLTPIELASMVKDIRTVESAAGNGLKQPCKAEFANHALVRKSIVASHTIKAGQIIAEDDISVKRPGSGRSPMDYWSVIGSKAERSYTEDEPLDP